MNGFDMVASWIATAQAWLPLAIGAIVVIVLVLIFAEQAHRRRAIADRQRREAQALPESQAGGN